jgi:hypothetical protein
LVSEHGEEEEDEIVEDADFVLELRVPLAVSTMTMRRGELVSAMPVARGRDDYPYVVAVNDQAGVFLVRSSAGPE